MAVLVLASSSNSMASSLRRSRSASVAAPVLMSLCRSIIRAIRSSAPAAPPEVAVRGAVAPLRVPVVAVPEVLAEVVPPWVCRDEI